jgi:hypothetical protein
MEKFTASYANSVNNFVLINLPDGGDIKSSKYYSIFSVVKNLLCR